MGFWQKPKTHSQTFLYTFRREEDYAEIMETVQSLVLKRVIHNLPTLTAAREDLMASNHLRRKDIWKGEGPVPTEIWKQKMSEVSYLGDCAWILYGKYFRGNGINI